MNQKKGRAHVLNPLERFSEIVFGLIMVLSFTCTLSVAEVGRDDVRTMMLAALGCNLAWGIIDAVFYLITCMAEQSRGAAMLRDLQKTEDPSHVRQILAEALPPEVIHAMTPSAIPPMIENLKQLPAPAEGVRFTGENWRGAFGVLLLVFASTLPVVIPFAFIHEPRLALRISNLIAVGLLFGAGHMLAIYAGLRPVLTGLAMVAIGVALVSLTIALGG